MTMTRLVSWALALCLIASTTTPAVQGQSQSATLATPPPAGAAAPTPVEPTCATCVTPGATCPGGGCDPSCSNLADRYPFSAGSLTFQSMVGYYSKSGTGPYGEAIDYAPLAARLGYICNAPSMDNALRGCYELVVEANYCPVTSTYGSYFTGANAFLRYNFVQEKCLLVPYIQAGAGFTFNDVYKSLATDRTLIGENFEFLLRAEGGVRVMISECISLDFEAGYQHISNGGLARHNGGLNDVGGAVGVTYFFGKCK